MSIIVAPTEPRTLKALGKVSLVTESKGADVLVVSKHTTVGVQRKTFPADYLSSMDDGRLADLALKLSGSVQIPVLVLEGQPKWTPDGALIDDRVRRFTLSNMNRMVLSFFAVYGITTYWTRTVQDTANLVTDFDVWASRAEHGQSLLQRPGPGDRDLRGRVAARNRAVYMIQALADGVGPDVAGRIFDHFGGVPLAWSVTAKAMGGVKGIGPKRVQALGTMIGYEEDE